MPLICWSFLLLVNWSNNSSFQIIFNSIIGEGNGKPLQNSCLGNFMNRGVWWATVPDVARVRHDTVTTHHHKPSQLIPKSGSLFTLLLLSNLFFWVWSHFPASCHIIIFYCTLDVVQKGTVETEVENILPYGSLCLLPANEVLSWVRAGCSLMTAVHPPVSGEWGQMSDDSFQRHLCIWYTSHGHGLFLSVPIQPPGTHLSLPTFSLPLLLPNKPVSAIFLSYSSDFWGSRVQTTWTIQQEGRESKQLHCSRYKWQMPDQISEVHLPAKSCFNPFM